MGNTIEKLRNSNRTITSSHKTGCNCDACLYASARYEAEKIKVLSEEESK